MRGGGLGGNAAMPSDHLTPAAAREAGLSEMMLRILASDSHYDRSRDRDSRIDPEAPDGDDDGGVPVRVLHFR